MAAPIEVLEGTRAVRVENDFFAPYETTVDVAAGDAEHAAELKIDLERVAVRRPGTP
ncbi:hypothetical protein D3C83_265620 [compost metagenome]